MSGNWSLHFDLRKIRSRVAFASRVAAESISRARLLPMATPMGSICGGVPRHLARPC